VIWLRDIAVAIWDVFFVASPYILLGLAAAGLLHVLVPADKVARWLGRPGFGSVARAAFLGIPLPLCSCAVVPVSIELSRKGASREASLAFLVSTPETGVDSILLTYGLMGPVMAVARPIAALVTSLVAAAASLLKPGPATERPAAASNSAPPAEEAACGDCAAPNPVASGKTRRALRYGLVEMVDEIGFWLVVGLVLTGFITALVPDGIIESTLGQGPGALLALLILGIPLYMCASASTPVAAALMLKGISPGAALVFLLAGPATNASSLVVIARFFGRRFVSIYLASVVAVALSSGFLLDLLVDRFGWSVEATLSAGESRRWLFHLLSTGLLLILLAASFVRGSWRTAIRDVARDLRQWRTLFGDELSG
jgi:uncharacterized membrane protein YraQ (UPF0718 family)